VRLVFLMSQDSDLTDPITVSAGDVSVEKSFAADEFPVPAIKFVVHSTSDDSVDLRLSDDVPESFPMDCVGFHPDYENDCWTAYQDHHVEFVRTLEPRESLTTVYGIRLEETDAEPSTFLGEPTIDLVSTDETGAPEAEGVEDIVGENTTDVVRDVLAGDTDTVPGMDESDDLDFEDPLAEDAVDPLAADDADDVDDAEEPLVLDDPLDEGDADGEEDPLAEDPLADDGEKSAEPDADEPLVLDDPLADDSSADDTLPEADEQSDPSSDDAVEPRSVDDETVSAVVERPAEAASPSSTDAPVADESTSEVHDGEDTESEQSTAVDRSETTTTAAEPASAATATASTGIAATLATEIREGRVDDDDLAVLKRELDVGVPNSVDVRIGRLQSQMDDLAAYSDALETFIDEEGTGEQLISEFRAEVDSVSSSLTTLETALTSAEADRVDLRDEVDDVATTVTALENRVETNTDDLSSVADEVAELAAVAESVETLAATVDSLDTEMGDVRADVADIDSDLAESHAQLEDELEAVREDVAEQVEGLRDSVVDDVEHLKREMDDIQAELVELKQFRDRLGSAFGGN
jgi:predicted  nucleic acid-binding Zn-ribbon protein